MIPEIENTMQTPPPVEYDFRYAQPLDEIHLLTTLRTFVLEADAKRCPKWRFRIGDDLVVQIQPQAKNVLFKGLLYQGHDFPKDLFKKARDSNYDCVSFVVRTDISTGGWELRPERVWLAPFARTREEFRARTLALRDTTLAAMRRLDSWDGFTMFRPNCLRCGKALTDPISMARWIGSECAHRVSFDARNRRLPTEPAQHAA
jgi:hypothetical protein